MLSPGLGLWETCSLVLRTGSKGGGRNLGSSPAIGRVKLLINTSWGDRLCPAERSGVVLPFHPPTPLLLAVIWVFGCVFPAGAPGIIEMREGEISGSGWPFLFLLSFLF